MSNALEPDLRCGSIGVDLTSFYQNLLSERLIASVDGSLNLIEESALIKLVGVPFRGPLAASSITSP